MRVGRSQELLGSYLRGAARTSGGIPEQNITIGIGMELICWCSSGEVVTINAVSERLTATSPPQRDATPDRSRGAT
jgi:hypothetical protein